MSSRKKTEKEKNIWQLGVKFYRIQVRYRTFAVQTKDTNKTEVLYAVIEEPTNKLNKLKKYRHDKSVFRKNININQSVNDVIESVFGYNQNDLQNNMVREKSMDNINGNFDTRKVHQLNKKNLL